MSLESVSFRNLVSHYLPELRRIKRGESASRVLSKGRRSSLLRQGVFRVGFAQHGRRLRLTDEAETLIEEMEAVIA